MIIFHTGQYILISSLRSNYFVPSKDARPVGPVAGPNKPKAHREPWPPSTALRLVIQAGSWKTWTLRLPAPGRGLDPCQLLQVSVSAAERRPVGSIGYCRLGTAFFTVPAAAYATGMGLPATAGLKGQISITREAAHSTNQSSNESSSFIMFTCLISTAVMAGRHAAGTVW